MPILNLMIYIILIGVLLWAVNVYIPMAPAIKNVLNLLVLVLVILYILQFFGLISPVVSFPALFK